MTVAKHIAVVGAGAWGTALACAAARAGNTVTLWARESAVVTAVNTQQENTPFLPGHRLPDAITATTDMAALASADAVLLVPPAQHMRAVSQAAAQYIGEETPVLICAKGIEADSGQLMSDVLQATLPKRPVCVLSGPTFAAEVADDLPCALTLAVGDTALANKLIQHLATPHFRLYATEDVIGAQVGGAIKNVLAIACGMVAGLGFGENARAAVITRGLAEMTRFAAAYGGKAQTLMGLSGVGDLILTCSSTQSRNFSLGKAVGENHSYEAVMAGRTSVAEGAHTVDVVHSIANEKGIEMPISSAVFNVLKQGADVHAVLTDLLARPFTWE